MPSVGQNERGVSHARCGGENILVCSTSHSHVERMSPSPLLRSLALGMQLGLTVALPLLVGVLGGRFLDRSFGTAPLFLLSGIILATILSLALVVREVRDVIGGKP